MPVGAESEMGHWSPPQTLRGDSWTPVLQLTLHHTRALGLASRGMPRASHHLGSHRKRDPQLQDVGSEGHGMGLQQAEAALLNGGWGFPETPRSTRTPQGSPCTCPSTICKGVVCAAPEAVAVTTCSFLPSEGEHSCRAHHPGRSSRPPTLALW